MQTVGVSQQDPKSVATSQLNMLPKSKPLTNAKSQRNLTFKQDTFQAARSGTLTP